MLPWSWAEERLAAARNYWIATASPQRGPHAMPVWGLWREGAFLFSTGERSRKARDLADDQRLVVHLESGADVVVVEAVVERFTTTQAVADEYERKYSWHVEAGAEWYRAVPRRAYAWQEETYPASVTAYDF